MRWQRCRRGWVDAASASRGAVSAGDRGERRGDRADVRGGGCQAVAGAAAGVSPERPPPAPGGAGLLGRSGLAGRGFVGRGAEKRWPRSLRFWLFSTKGTRAYTDAAYREGDVLVFGPESRGLPAGCWRSTRSEWCGFPMRAEARSLNLANAASIAIYEAMRQVGWSRVDER